MLGAEEPNEISITVRRPEPRDDILDRTYRVGLPLSGDAIKVQEEQRGWRIDKAVVASVDTAMNDVRDLPLRSPAFEVGRRTTDQKHIAPSRVVAKVPEQARDRCWNARHALAKPCTTGILLDGAITCDGLTNKLPTNGFQLSDIERRERERDDDRVSNKPASARENGSVARVDCRAADL